MICIDRIGISYVYWLDVLFLVGFPNIDIDCRSNNDIRIDYDNSLTWIKAIWDDSPLRLSSCQWGLSEVVITYPYVNIYIYGSNRYIYIYIIHIIYVYSNPQKDIEKQNPTKPVKNYLSFSGGVICIYIYIYIYIIYIYRYKHVGGS